MWNLINSPSLTRSFTNPPNEVKRIFQVTWSLFNLSQNILSTIVGGGQGVLVSVEGAEGREDTAGW